MKIFYTAKQKDKMVAWFSDMVDNAIGNWEKPWSAICGYKESKPINMLTKSEYGAFNSFLLASQCSINGWKLPYFVTYEKVLETNLAERAPYVSGQGEPIIMRDKRTKKDVVDADTGKVLEYGNIIISTYNKYTRYDKETDVWEVPISYSKYAKLSKEEQDEYKPIKCKKANFVFNIEQTSFPELHPKAWEQMMQKLEEKPEVVDFHSDDVVYENLDKVLFEKGGWRCPISLDGMDSAYFSHVSDSIHLPTLESFKLRSKFYSTALHEMAHSTMIPLKRNYGHGGFGSPSYAKEELVAEFTAAIVSYNYGIEVTHDKKSPFDKEHLQYIKSWRKQCKNPDEVIREIIDDIFDAVNYETNYINYVDDKIKQYKKKTT